jgi:hypothetical protein
MSIRFVALETATVRALQQGRPDANGQPPERHVSDGNGVPCRHCLAHVGTGEPYLILAHRPFPVPQPYAEVGPIFLHAEACSRREDSADIPSMLRSPQYLIRGYGADDRIVYGSGRIVPTDQIPRLAREMLGDTRISYVHVRSASNNCYQCRIDRA